MAGRRDVIEVSGRQLTISDAQALQTRLIARVRSVRTDCIEIGEILYAISKSEAFRLLGYDSFDDIIAQPHIGLSRTHAYNLMSIYRKFVVDLQIPREVLIEIDWTKLDLIKPSITGENAEQLLDKAKNLSVRDLRAEMETTPTSKEMDDSPKEAEHLKSFIRLSINEMVSPDKKTKSYRLTVMTGEMNQAGAVVSYSTKDFFADAIAPDVSGNIHIKLVRPAKVGEG